MKHNGSFKTIMQMVGIAGTVIVFIFIAGGAWVNLTAEVATVKINLAKTDSKVEAKAKDINNIKADVGIIKSTQVRGIADIKDMQIVQREMLNMLIELKTLVKR